MSDWFETWFDEDYALLYAHRNGAEARLAVERVLREAPELASGPVLDLGCGAGRHLEILRSTNPLAFGLDLSPALLRMAPAPLHPWLLRGDMRRLPLKPATVSGICLWFTPFGYFADAENRELVQSLARCLKDGGVLLMDYLNVDLVRRSLVPEDAVMCAGVKVVSRRAIEGSRLVKRMELTNLETGDMRQAMESVRLYPPAEVQEMAAWAGLTLRRVMGTYAGGDFAENSPRWIGIFEKPKRR